MSLPSWERGLKFLLCQFILKQHHVAPLVGARVEIVNMVYFRCGLCVAPLVGARVEIATHGNDHRLLIVAPLVGARVEMANSAIVQSQSQRSLPSWERGLKFFYLP